jgi:Leucine-rich repeat (LRR) protein
MSDLIRATMKNPIFVLTFLLFASSALYGQSGYSISPAGINFQGMLFADKLKAARAEFDAQDNAAPLRSISARGLDQEGLRLLCESVPELERLELLYSPDISDLSVLRALPGLLELRLQGLEQISDLNTLPELPALRTLLMSCLPMQEVRGFDKLPRLTELELQLPGLTDFRGLSEIKRLETLKIKAEDLGDLSFLQELNRLLWLELAAADFSNIEALQQLNRLRILRISNAAASQKNLNLQFLRGCRNISQLQLRNLFLQETEALRALSKLVYLDLGSCQGLESLEMLRNMPMLRTVRLPRADFKPEDFEALRKGVNIYFGKETH